MKHGILGAILEEVAAIKHLMVVERETNLGGRTYIEGTLNSHHVVLTFSRIGKVAASSTVTTLIHKFNVDFILFTGVAGAVHPELNIGDVVIGDGLYQHDMDATPLFLQYEIPLTNSILFKPHPTHVSNARLAANHFLKHITTHIDEQTLIHHTVHQPVVHQGMIASGDLFVKNPSTHPNLMHKHDNQTTLAVEMEGAAVAQVCHEHNIPYLVIRTISDKANHAAAVDFQSFIKNIAQQYSAGIIQAYFHEPARFKSNRLKFTAMQPEFMA
jgi:adenosylhomocysteine nucleosidase